MSPRCMHFVLYKVHTLLHLCSCMINSFYRCASVKIFRLIAAVVISNIYKAQIDLVSVKLYRKSNFTRVNI